MNCRTTLKLYVYNVLPAINSACGFDESRLLAVRLHKNARYKISKIQTRLILLNFLEKRNTTSKPKILAKLQIVDPILADLKISIP
jgi:hypothetical protein